MPDIFSYDIAEALALSGCPLCRALAVDDRRWMDSFWREGKQGADAGQRFFAAGGFCRHHGWLLHRLVAAEGTGAAIADLYGWLADYDLRWLGQVRRSLPERRRGRRATALTRRGRCPACRASDESVERKVAFFVEVLGEQAVRERYSRSEGLCFTHLAAVVEQALADEDLEAGLFLIDDWRLRLREVRAELAEYDRKRDYRYAHEPKAREQRSWTEVIRRYVGEDFAGTT